MDGRDSRLYMKLINRDELEKKSRTSPGRIVFLDVAVVMLSCRQRRGPGYDWEEFEIG